MSNDKAMNSAMIEDFKRLVKDKFTGFHFEKRVCITDEKVFQENKLNEYLYFYEKGLSACAHTRQEERKATIEECAKVCDEYATNDNNLKFITNGLARSIRALQPSTEGE